MENLVFDSLSYTYYICYALLHICGLLRKDLIRLFNLKALFFFVWNLISFLFHFVQLFWSHYKMLLKISLIHCNFFIVLFVSIKIYIWIKKKKKKLWKIHISKATHTSFQNFSSLIFNISVVLHLSNLR